MSTVLSPLVPTKVGTQGRSQALFRMQSCSLKPVQASLTALGPDFRRDERR
jgi:hypothetical protein